MIQRLWESGQYETWLETKRTKPTVGVHRALVVWGDGKPRDSHLKIVFDYNGLHSGHPSRHLAHEAVAWLCGRALKLPVPQFAGFIVLTPEQIARAHPDRPRGGETAAWVTSTEPVRGLTISESMEEDEQLTRELKKWPALHSACAFDEWLANVDRYPRNLLRRGENDFVLIDHDFIAGGPTWLADLLRESHFDDFRNVLRDRCSPPGSGDPGPERAFSNAMLASSESYPKALEATVEALRTWIDLLVEDAADQSALADFVKARAAAASNLIRRRYKLLM